MGGGGGGVGGEVSGERDLLYWSNKTVARLELGTVSAVAQHSPGTLASSEPLSSGNIIETEPPLTFRRLTDQGRERLLNRTQHLL